MKGLKTGGRQKGTLNQRTQRIMEITEKFSMDPFEILMNFATGDWKALGYDAESYVMENASGGTKIGYTISPDMRLEASKEACKYLYSKRRDEQQPDKEEIDVSTPEQKRALLEQAEREIKRLKDELTKINE